MNLGYHDWRNWIVDFVNDAPIRDFAHFASLLKNNTGENVVFENENGYQMVINHSDAIETESSILSQYRIPSAYSTDLFAE